MKTAPSVRMRIVLREGRAMGPGKADILGAIDELGSIAAAGRSMGMSYQRAWSLVNELNHIFRKPLVAVSRGGSERGGARLTATGREVLTAYRTIERVAAEHCRPELEKLLRLAAEKGSDISIGR
ncbi:MAG: LysR family transcriptional regulator [Candidatus Eremiobacteraeota bacterium]|nr:LysR family transcriptional regulator [Candidatus Eremiobacteraeota bacterium]